MEIFDTIQPMQLLEVQDLRTYFHLHEGTVRAVDGVSFDICCGRTLGVIGESGCGKSVTAQSILRLVPEPPGEIVEGHIRLYIPRADGTPGEVVDITSLDPTGGEMRAIRWKEIAMIFQEPMTSLSPVHTIDDQITEAMLLHLPGITKREARERAIDLLKSVGIPQADKFIDAYSYQLSGGMRQRAMIALALSCGPHLLIADEPTTALDVTIAAQILALLRQLKSDYAMAMLYISHDLAVISEVSDDVMVMYLGVAVEVAEAGEIFHHPLHPYTQALWRSIPTLKGELTRLMSIAGTVPSPYVIHKGCRFFGRCESAIPGKCNKAEPALVEVAANHKVRCFLHSDLESPSRQIEPPLHTKRRR
jgi:oligopeptide/dipeptide ABC transporter ATP-binding protein